MVHAAPMQSLIEQVINTQLTDSTEVCIRTIQTRDEARMRAGIQRLSSHSRYLRFFSNQPIPTDSVIKKLIDVDGYHHIGWGAILTAGTDNPAIGAVHVFREGEHSFTGELSFAIVDAYHGLGLARMLMAVLLTNCRLAAITSLQVHILSENRVAAKFILALGGVRKSAASGVSDYELDCELALSKLQAQTEHIGLKFVFSQLESYA